MHGQLLKLVKVLEVGNFDAAQYELHTFNISAEDLMNMQVECMAWATQLSSTNESI